MAKKSEINKKGRLAKSTLSVVLAASMVLTSSSFVWAAPVKDIAVVEEGETAVEAVEVPVDEEVGTSVDEVSEASVEENVGAVISSKDNYDISIAPVTFTGKAMEPDVTIRRKSSASVDAPAESALDYSVKYSNNTNVGTANYTVTFSNEGITDYVGTFEIKPIDLSDAANTTVSITLKENEGFVYNGKKQTPEISKITAKVGNTAAVEVPSTDYEIVPAAGYDLKSAASQQFAIEGKNNFTGEYTGTPCVYVIEQDNFNENTVVIESSPVAYKNGAPVEADVKVKDKEGNSIAGCTTKYFDDKGQELAEDVYPSDMGTHTIQIVCDGTGNYKAGTINTTYTITGGTLAMAVKSAEFYQANGTKIVDSNDNGIVDFVYNKAGQAPASVVLSGVNPKEYEVEDIYADDSVNSGTYQIKITGKNTFAGQTATVSYEILPAQLTAVNVTKPTPTGVNTDYTYTATLGRTHSGAYADQATMSLTDNRTTSGVEVNVLEEGKDYTYTTDKSKKEVVVTGLGNYTTVDPTDKTKTTLRLDYDTSEMLDVNDSSIKVTVNGTFKYDGTQVRPTDIVVTEGTYTLIKGTDYEVAYGANNTTGEGQIYIKGIGGRYTGTRIVKFNISGTTFSDTFKVASIADVVYDSTKSQKLVPTVTYKSTGATAPSGAYDLIYYRDGKKTTDFINTGTITVEVKGKGKYEGSIKVSYSIVGEAISSIAKIANIADQQYTGKEITPTVKLEAITGTRVFTKDKDYTVTYKDNIESGTAYVIVKGIGQYSGELVKSFKIVGQMDQNFEFLAAQVRDIKKRTLASKTTTVKYDVAPKTDVTYASSDEKVFTVDAKTGAIAYTGVGTATLTATAAASDKYKAETKTMTVKVVPVTPANVKVTSTAKRKITVKAGEVKEAAKYQIRIQKNGRSSVYVNVDNVGDLNKVYTTKSSGKFNVWVRAYTTIGEKDHHFSSWSAKKTVTVK